MLNVAVRKKFLFANPCAGVEFPARVDGLFRPHYVTWSEQRKIEFAAPEYLLAAEVRHLRPQRRVNAATAMSVSGTSVDPVGCLRVHNPHLSGSPSSDDRWHSRRSEKGTLPAELGVLAQFWRSRGKCTAKAMERPALKERRSLLESAEGLVRARRFERPTPCAQAGSEPNADPHSFNAFRFNGWRELVEPR